MEWNESVFDVQRIPYVRQAYHAGMYAFVSDYVRLHAVYHHGGIYLDTDVSLVRRFDGLLEQDLVFGFEMNRCVATSTFMAKPRSEFLREFMKTYHARDFIGANHLPDLTTNVQILTDRLVRAGLERNGCRQYLRFRGNEQILVLERERFSPFDYNTNTYLTNTRTFAVHHFHSSWSDAGFRFRFAILYRLIRIAAAAGAPGKALIEAGFGPLLLGLMKHQRFFFRG